MAPSSALIRLLRGLALVLSCLPTACAIHIPTGTVRRTRSEIAAYGSPQADRWHVDKRFPLRRVAVMPWNALSRPGQVRATPGTRSALEELLKEAGFQVLSGAANASVFAEELALAGARFNPETGGERRGFSMELEQSVTRRIVERDGLDAVVFPEFYARNVRVDDYPTVSWDDAKSKVVTQGLSLFSRTPRPSVVRCSSVRMRVYLRTGERVIDELRGVAPVEGVICRGSCRVEWVPEDHETTRKAIEQALGSMMRRRPRS